MSINTLERPVLDAAQFSLEARGIDLAKPGYRQAWRLLGHVAEELGVEVRLHDIEHLASNFGIMRAVDDLVDEDHQSDVTVEVRQLVGGEEIKGVSTAEAALFAEVMDRYEEERREAQVRGLASFPHFAMHRRAANTLRSILAVNRAEAGMLAGLLALPSREDLSYAQMDGRQKFDSWLKDFLWTGYLVDSCLDMKDDYVNGTTSVRPTLKTRLATGGLATIQALQTLCRTPRQSLGEVAIMSGYYIG